MTTKTTTRRTLYVHLVLNGAFFFAQILCDNVPYTPGVHPVKFSPHCYFDKLCFQPPQNVTWTDESRG